MNNLAIYKNIKRWLFLYGTGLLDVVLPIENPTSCNPLERYKNLNTMFDKHINLLSYYAVNVAEYFPLILISFEDIESRYCSDKTLVIFDIYFQTISPSDCKDETSRILNSPEAILYFQNRINEELNLMMHCMGDDLKNMVFDDKKWEYPINYKVINTEFKPLEGVTVKEILYFRTTFTLVNYESCC